MSELFLAQEPGLGGTPRAHDVVGGTKTALFLTLKTLKVREPASFLYGKMIHLLSRRHNKTESFKDVRAHCYCASLVRTLFIGHARARHFQARAPIRKLNKT